jgi:hypothetical protein
MATSELRGKELLSPLSYNHVLIPNFEVIVSSKPVFAVCMLLLMVSAEGTAVSPQISGGGSVSPVRQRPDLPVTQSGPQDGARSKMERDMAKKANEERHAALRRDTDRLLRLTTELKAYVDKSSQNTLSLEVVKKAEEIEKLAHSVKEKMKGN